MNEKPNCTRLYDGAIRFFHSYLKETKKSNNQFLNVCTFQLDLYDAALLAMESRTYKLFYLRVIKKKNDIFLTKWSVSKPKCPFIS